MAPRSPHGRRYELPILIAKETASGHVRNKEPQVSGAVGLKEQDVTSHVVAPCWLSSEVDLVRTMDLGGGRRLGLFGHYDALRYGAYA